MNANDERADGRWQREAVSALMLVLEATDFTGGILLAVTPENRIVPVMILPDYADVPGAAAEILRGALVHVEAGRFSAEPRAIPPNG